MKLCHELGPEDWTIVESVLHNNAYFAHPENILLAGIADSKESVRRFAHEKIIKSQVCTEGNNIRLFDKDNIVLKQDAISYMDMISWESTSITTPPLISNISNDQLLQCSFQSLRGILCHSQAVEQTIKVTSTTVLKVLGHTSRHGMVLQNAKSREGLPSVDTKADFL